MVEELFSAQYFLTFLVLTRQFWIKSLDKCLNFSSEGIFRGPWIICELFHNFSIFAVILSMLDTCIVFFFFQYPKQFFAFLPYLSLWTLTRECSAEGKTWPVYNSNTWIIAHPPKDLSEITGPPEHTGCTIKHGLCALDFSTRHFIKD